MTARSLREVLERVDLSVPVDPSATYQMMGVRSFGRGAFATADLRGADTRYPTLRRVERGLLVYPKLMAWEGAFAVVPDDLHGRFVSPEFVAFRPSSKVEPAYLAHLVAWEGFRGGLGGLSAGTNARRRRLQPDQLLDFRVPLPDISVQRRIAAHLDSMGHVQRTRQAKSALWNAATESLRNAVFAEVDADEVPVGRVVEQRRHAVDVTPGGTYPMVGLLNRGRGLFSRGTIAGEQTKYRHLFRVSKGQLIYSKLFGWEGSVGIVPPDMHGHFVSSEFPTFDVNSRIVDLAYLGQVFRSTGVAAQLAAATTGMGQRRQRVNIDDFLAIRVPLPDLDEQRVIASHLLKGDALRRLDKRRELVLSALLPAARNEIFNSMR